MSLFPFLFFFAAICLAAGALGTIFFPHTRGALYFFSLSLLGGAVEAWSLHAPLVGLCLMLWAACAFFVQLNLTKRLPAPLPEGTDPDKRFWAGLVSALFLIMASRIVIGSPWGQTDRSYSYLLQDFPGRNLFVESLKTIWSDYGGMLPLAALIILLAASLYWKEKRP